MKLDKTELINIVNFIRHDEEIRLTDIPDIELYMDQLLTFLNGKLKAFAREPGDKILTKTMINNYTKFQLLIPPKNKKYANEHILLLILIYQLKNVLSISDIKRLFGPILRDITTPDDDIMPLGEIYSSFLGLKKIQFDDFCNNLADKVSAIENQTAGIENESNRNITQIFLVVLMLVAQADAAKLLAERIIDLYFTPGANEDTDETKSPPAGGQPT
jgi:Domain of unknown function (DUF1836).